MCQYFSNTEDQCSQVMKKETKEAFENNMDHYDTMKTVGKAYLNHSSCSVQKEVYHILPKLKLMKMFPGVYFVYTNVLEERVQVLLSEKKTYRTTR